MLMLQELLLLLEVSEDRLSGFILIGNATRQALKQLMEIVKLAANPLGFKMAQQKQCAII